MECCGGLVAPAAGSGGVGVRVLEVDPAVPRGVRRVLGVCFWHLLCCIQSKRVSGLTIIVVL